MAHPGCPGERAVKWIFVVVLVRMCVPILRQTSAEMCMLLYVEAADSCTLNAVCFLSQSEVAAVNSIGQFKIWDVRQSSAEPVRVFVP